ncbi:hypothetical protein [Agrobacterium tumefaciens]|uniref:hypothetical protein n=1 Tax=Agrobacterium tumefaciens TaxID=358 RepID=UPI001CBE1041|nr:hypothetical protein [Agrobacterium tumefaciens]MDP9875615.1 hypothetical protein [Agrobacterium tumefaciens]MDP9980530.1 hypothetical protein [Agrobacterium tumefaciens]
MTELKYLPSAWQDECIPEPQENPNAFIHRAANGWLLRPVDSYEEENYSQPLQPGDIVRFDEHRAYGDFMLIIDEEGEWRTEPTLPADACFFRHERDTDTLAMSVDELISFMEMREGEYSIDAYWWSDYEVPLRFVVEGDMARFERIEGAAQ